MKKELNVKKLQLSRETLRGLEAGDLDAVAGGLVTTVTKKHQLCSNPCTKTCLC